MARFKVTEFNKELPKYASQIIKLLLHTAIEIVEEVKKLAQMRNTEETRKVSFGTKDSFVRKF